MALPTLSVRSGFDLLLRTLDLPAGSEIIMSALTVPDMEKIVRAHGLVPVGVDLDAQYRVEIDSLRSAITPQTKLCVVAHLFGDRMPLAEVAQVLQPHGIPLVEDCAQCYHGPDTTIAEVAGVAMFSFGPIKTSTALGGGMIVIRDEKLRHRMAELLDADPIQSRWSYARRVARFSLLKVLMMRLPAGLFYRICQLATIDVDELLTRLAKGFPGPQLISKIRHQPSAPLMKMMARRWRRYDSKRMSVRRQRGQQLDALIGRRHSAQHSYWVYPMIVDDVNSLATALVKAGYDATTKSRMSLIPAGVLNRSLTIQSRWRKVIFVPLYTEMSRAAVANLGNIINAQGKQFSLKQQRRTAAVSLLRSSTGD